MKAKYLLIPFALGLGLALVWVLGGRGGAAVAAPRVEGQIETPSALAAELRVCPSGCTYSSIQNAVNAANEGDVIKVAAGTYTDVQRRTTPAWYGGSGVVTQVVYISKTVTVRGGYTTDNWTTSDPENNPTTLDAGGQRRVIFIIGDPSPVSGQAISPTVEGLRITGGGNGVSIVRATATISGSWVFANTRSALDLFSSDVTISRNRIFSNTARGLHLWCSDATIIGNTITGNIGGSGGGLYLESSTATIISNTITGNIGEHGGGVYADHSRVSISGNTITDNTANRVGGGLYAAGESPFELKANTIIVDSNTISGNTAGDRAGGLFLAITYATVTGNTITDNTANNGGGLYLGPYGNNTLINNIIADNQADVGGFGLHMELCSASLLHNTIAHNTGGDGSGISVGEDSSVTLTNTILVDHAMGIYVDSGSTAMLESTLWNGNTADWGGGGTVRHTNDRAGNPALVDPDAGDYHIGPGSAAVDGGVNAGVITDIDGGPRPAAFGFDIGADERPGTSLHMHKAPWLPYLNPGQALTYTLVITSAGVDTATDVWLTDTLPTLQQAVDITASQGKCAAGAEWGSTVACDLGTMLPGASARITFTARVTTTPPAQLPWPMRNTAWIKAAETMRNTSFADTMLHDCHVQLNDGPTEYSTVQAGVDASTQPGDVVKVSGYCAGVTSRAGVAQIAYLSKTLTLQGGWNAAFTQRDVTRFPTTLDAWRQGRILYITDPLTDSGQALSTGSGRAISPTVEGLRITGGDAAAGLGGHTMCTYGCFDVYFGGGVYINTGTIFRDNQVFSNIADYGGGLYLEGSTATLSGNTVADNTAEQDGGGLYLEASNATIISNTITGNVGNFGGGLLLNHSSASISGNTITDNTANSNGGGLCAWDRARFVQEINKVIVNGNTISGNTGDHGGGLYLRGTDATVNGNIISGNTANQGGGLYLGRYGHDTLINNLVAYNEADDLGCGLYVEGASPRLLHTTIAHNCASGGSGDGSGIYVTDRWDPYSTVALTNTILVSHTVGINVAAGNTVTLESTLWNDNTTDWGGEGTLIHTNDHTGDPAFLNPEIAGRRSRGDYHIGPGSAAIDAGVDAGVDHDIDGDPRPLGSGYDIGADELGLFVTKQATPDPVEPGAPLTYTISVTNITDMDVHATITDTLPEHITLGKTSGGTLILPGGVVTWTGVSLLPQGVWSETVVVTVETGYAGPLVNVVEVTTEEEVNGGYAHTLAPDLAVTKHAHADTVQPGEPLTYTITVTNTGNFDLHAMVTDTLPANVTAGATAGGTTVLPGGKLVWTPVIPAPGGVWMRTVVVTAEVGYAGPLINLVEVMTEEGAAGTASATVSAGFHIYLPVMMRDFWW